MFDPSDARLAVIVGGKSIRQHIEEALQRGDLRLTEDGYLTLGNSATRTLAPFKDASFEMYFGRLKPDGTVQQDPGLYPCMELLTFFFKQVYQQATVPHACQNCYKVKVFPSTLRQMMAVKAIAESLPYISKSGNELHVKATPGIYATYFYLHGLEEARSAYAIIRARLDADEKLGPSVKAVIKRGCSEYERKLGPSDQYTFDPALEAAEEYLHSVYRKPENSQPRPSKAAQKGLYLLHWIQLAYQVGDETYKDFTAGKPPYPPTMTYPPKP